MNTKVTLICIFLAVILINGIVAGKFPEIQGLAKITSFWLPIIINTGLMFSWVIIDSKQRHFSRSPLLNVGIIGLTIIFLPVYLYKSRNKNERVKAIGIFFLIFGGSILASIAGVAIGYAI